MKLENLILGHLLIQPELLKNLDIDKDFFKDQRQRLAFREIQKGNGDLALIAEKIKIEGISSYLSGLLDGIAKTDSKNLPKYVNEVKINRLKEDVLKLINHGAKTGNFEYEKIKGIYQEIERLDSLADGKRPQAETLKEFLACDFPQRQTLIDPIFGLQEMIMIHGRPKIGKSLLTLQLARCLITGENWLGFKVNKLGRPILIIQVEIAQALMQERSQKIFKDIAGSEKIIIPFQNRNIFLNQKTGQEHVSHLIEDYKPALVILDPYLKFFTDEETAFKNPRPFFDFWQEQIELHKLSLLFIHHDAKFQEGKIGGQKALGSTSINASTDGNWNIERILNVNLNPDEFLRTAQLSFESRNWQNMKPLDIRLNDNLAFEVTTLPKGSVDEWDIVEEIEKAGGQIDQSKLIKQYSSVKMFYQAKSKAIEKDLIDEVKLKTRGYPVVLMLKKEDIGNNGE